MTFPKRLIRDEYVEPDKYIEVNEKTLKVYAVFSKGIINILQTFESSNHFFSESKQGTSKKISVKFFFRM